MTSRRHNSGDSRERLLERRILEGDAEAWRPLVAAMRRRGATDKQISLKPYELVIGSGGRVHDHDSIDRARRLEFELAAALAAAGDVSGFAEMLDHRIGSDQSNWTATCVRRGLVPSLDFLRSVWRTVARPRALLPEEKHSPNGDSVSDVVGLKFSCEVLIAYFQDPRQRRGRPIRVAESINHGDEWEAWIHGFDSGSWPVGDLEAISEVCSSASDVIDATELERRLREGDLGAWLDVRSYLGWEDILIYTERYSGRSGGREDCERALVLEIALDEKGWL